MKRGRQALLIMGVVFAICLMGSVYLARTVWPIDVISGREAVVGRCALRNGESVELVQVWADDGYMTLVRHHSGIGVLNVVGNPDASKIWNVSMNQDLAAGCVRLRFNGSEWKYFYDSHSLSAEGRVSHAF